MTRNKTAELVLGVPGRNPLMDQVTYFPDQAAFRDWLTRNHDSVVELNVGFYKKGSGVPSITYPEALDEALCFGWIDGVRTRIDDQRYKIRFTPRRKGSIWSQVNIDKAEALIAAGRMHTAGLRCFQERDVEKTNRYSFEREQVAFDEAREKRFREQAAAWEFYQALPSSFRKTCTWWVMSAKQETTRDRRLGQLIEASAAGRRIDFMKSGSTKT